jgi:hypothetical protein
MTFEASTVVMPKAISIGGTLMSWNVPDIESLPPIEGRPSSTCIFSAPSSAPSGLPHDSGFRVIRSKYS